MKLSEYISENKEEILLRVEKSTRPLLPDEEQAPEIPSLRKPYEAQARVIEGAKRSLKRDKACFVIGEMGTGKTLIGSLIPEDGSKIVVLCPSHLTEKWVREIHQTRPNSRAVIIRSLKDCDQLIRELPRGTETLWYILSKESAKLSYLWKRACLVKREERWIYDRQKKEKVLSEINTCVCPDCASYVTRTDSRGNEFFLSPEALDRNRTFCHKCKAALWEADNKRRRKYSLAEYLKKRHARLDYLIIDEAHEYKAQDSAQGNSLGALASISDKKVMLTGTLIGGYASHIYYLLWRTLPHLMKNRGYDYRNAKAFIARYGVREQVIREFEGDASSNKRSKGLTNRGTWQERPGISPELFTDFLLGTGIYVQLDDLAANLPPLYEQPVEIEMDPQQELAYKALERDLKQAIAQDLAKGNRRLLSKLLINLLAFPDKPFENSQIDLNDGRFVNVPNLDSSQTFPKEEKLIQLALEAKERGSRTLIFCQFTSSRDIQPRLREKLEEAGLRTVILRSSITPEKREEWIKQNALNNDCLICNPEVVKTGLDLYAYTTIIFYQTGYNIFTVRQASRRSWRLGQEQPCHIFYLYYSETMQSRAIELIANKIKTATALDGKLSNEGLNQLAEEDDALLLAKALVEGLKSDKATSLDLSQTASQEPPKAQTHAKDMNANQQTEMILNMIRDSGKRLDRLALQTRTGIPFTIFVRLMEKLQDSGAIEMLPDRSFRVKMDPKTMEKTEAQTAVIEESVETEPKDPSAHDSKGKTGGMVFDLLNAGSFTADYIAQHLNIDLEEVYELLTRAQKNDQILAARTPASILWTSRKNFVFLPYAESRVIKYLKDNGPSDLDTISHFLCGHALPYGMITHALNVSLPAKFLLREVIDSKQGYKKVIYAWNEDETESESIQAEEVLEERDPSISVKAQLIEHLKDKACNFDLLYETQDKFATANFQVILREMISAKLITKRNSSNGYFYTLTENIVETVKDFEFYRKLRDSKIPSKRTRKTVPRDSTPQLTLFA